MVFRDRASIQGSSRFKGLNSASYDHVHADRDIKTNECGVCSE